MALTKHLKGRQDSKVESRLLEELAKAPQTVPASTDEPRMSFRQAYGQRRRSSERRQQPRARRKVRPVGIDGDKGGVAHEQDRRLEGE